MADVEDIVRSLSPEEIAELKVALGLRKPSKKKAGPSEEYLKAKAALDAVVAENPQLIERYEQAKEALRKVRKPRQRLATLRYDGEAMKQGRIVLNGRQITTIYEDDWPKKMLAAGFTRGQVQTVKKFHRSI